MAVTEVGMVTEVREVQDEKTSLMTVTEVGMDTEEREVQALKA
jgi:hypothetical protein